MSQSASKSIQDWARRGRILCGERREAEYTPTAISDYSGNPWVEALPPIMTESEVVQRLKSLPPFSPEERKLPDEVRGHCIQRVSELIVPLARHLALEQAISRAIRSGYKSRNPISPSFNAKLREDDGPAVASIAQRCQPSANGFALFGVSGIGKSTAIEQILQTYPQVIRHTRYRGEALNHEQVVWLKIDCPHDASLKALLFEILVALDSALGFEPDKGYLRKYAAGNKTIDQLVTVIRKLAWVHALGILVIDEIQLLSQAKSGNSDNIVNFFLSLVNTLGVPVIPVGTVKAIRYMTKQFRYARRATGQGDMFWDRLGEDDWRLLSRVLGKYQWLAEEADMSSELQQALYNESAGITDIAVKLFMLTQYRAIASGQSKLTAELVRETAKESLRLIRPMLAALNQRDEVSLMKYDDLYLKWNEEINGLLVPIAPRLCPDDFDAASANTSKIVAWLMEAGFEYDLSTKAVNEVLKEGLNADLPSMKQKAYDRASEFKAGRVQEVNISSSVKRPKVKPKQNDGDLRLVGIQANKSNKLTTALLKEKGLLKAE